MKSMFNSLYDAIKYMEINYRELMEINYRELIFCSNALLNKMKYMGI